MKTLNTFLLVIMLGIGMSPLMVNAQTGNADDWEFDNWYDGTEDVSRDQLSREIVLMPNPTISGETMRILFPDNLNVKASEVSVYDAKGSRVSANVEMKDRNILDQHTGLKSRRLCGSSYQCHQEKIRDQIIQI